MRWVYKKIFRIFGNFYWKIFGGILLWVVWFLVATAFLCSVVGFPFAVQFYKISWVVFKPFGKQVVVIADKIVWSIIWFFSFGIVLGMLCVVAWVGSSLALVGLPLFKQWYKVTKLAFFPFCAKFA